MNDLLQMAAGSALAGVFVTLTCTALSRRRRGEAALFAVFALIDIYLGAINFIEVLEAAA